MYGLKPKRRYTKDQKENLDRYLDIKQLKTMIEKLNTMTKDIDYGVSLCCFFVCDRRKDRIVEIEATIFDEYPHEFIELFGELKIEKNQIPLVYLGKKESSVTLVERDHLFKETKKLIREKVEMLIF